MLAILERIKDSALRVATGRGHVSVPPQALREYDVTDEGCRFMQRRFADSFMSDEEWDDVQQDERRVVAR